MHIYRFFHVRENRKNKQPFRQLFTHLKNKSYEKYYFKSIINKLVCKYINTYVCYTISIWGLIALQYT